jgi:predicted MPP superfamily phosphohydrolase
MRFKKSRLNAIFYGFLISIILCQNAAWGDIAIFGDSQNYEAVQRKIVQAVLSFKPSAVFRVGDNVDDGLNPGQWKAFKEINEPLLKMGAYFPALGNHEKDSPLYFDTFPFLDHRRWYSVERETIHFIILDSNSDLHPGSAQYDWLETDLQSIKKDVKFRIVIFHHPIFDVGFHSADVKKLKAVLMPLFQKYEVSAVFTSDFIMKAYFLL